MPYRRLVPIGLFLCLVAVIVGTVLSDFTHWSFVPIVIGEFSLSTPIPTTTPFPTPEPTDTPVPDWRNLGLVGEPISDISTSQGAIYVSTYGIRHGIFKTENLGEKWSAINNGLIDFDVWRIEVAPFSNEVTYALTDHYLWSSFDGGESWYIELSSDTNGCVIRTPGASLAILSTDGSKLLLYCQLRSALSEDFGETWEFSNIEYSDCWVPLELIAERDYRNIVYGFSERMACRYESNFVPIAAIGPQLWIYDMSVVYSNPDYLFAGTENGMYKSDDGGLSWVPINNTLPGQGLELDCVSVQTSPWDSLEVFALCNGLVFQTKDSGRNWTPISAPEGLKFLYTMSQPKILLAASLEDGLWGYEIP